jgi:cysteine-rich repeat protein
MYEDVAQGTPLADPTPGDCARLACDGRGGSERIDDPGDVEDDGVLCTLDVCEGGVPMHTPGMAPCYSGPPGTQGVGVCVAGAQACDDGGMPFGACLGEVLPQTEVCDPAGLDEDCDGEVDEADAGCTCSDGATRPCFGGPEGMQDVGACASGEQTCAGGSWGACVGEVLPSVEDCDGAVDEDCDGAVDEEGRSCVCGDGTVSNDEPCDDGNASDDDACAAGCVAQRTLLAAAGHGHNCALLSGGVVKCWGSNAFHKLGWPGVENIGDAPGEMGDALPVINLGAGKVAKLVRGGIDHTCVVFEEGTVKCFGAASLVGLEQPPGIVDMIKKMGDDLPLVDLGAGAVVVDLQIGSRHTCVLLQGGAIKCFGYNNYGQLGLGDVLARGTVAGTMGDDLPTVDLGAGAEVAQLSLGYSTSCALLTTGAVKCWGQNSAGELGQGDLEHRGDQPGEMGDALPPIDLGTGAKAVTIAAGANHVCVLLDDASVKCWGYNGSGRLGQGDMEDRGDQPGEMGDALPAVDLGDGTVVALEATVDSSCATFVDLSVKCWGANSSGQLLLGDQAVRGDGPGEMGDALPELDFGAGKILVALDGSAGGHHYCATFTDGTVKCWGLNHYGQLGMGHKSPYGWKPEHVGDGLPTVKLFTDAW